MLVSFSLVRREKASKNLVMHPLVHAWLSDRQNSPDKRTCNARNAICIVNRAMFNACNMSQFADVQALYSHVFKCNTLVDKYKRLLVLIDISRLGGCIIAVDAWVPLSVDQATLEKSDKFYQLIVDNSSESSWQIPEAMWQIRKAYRLSSQGYRKQSSALCESYFKTSSPQNRFEEMYRACMAQMYGPSLFRQLNYTRAEEIYARSSTDCDESGYMLARKNLVLGAIKIDLNQLTEAEQFLLSCSQSLQHQVGPDFFIRSVWHLLMALCRLAQGRPEDAEQIVSPVLRKRLDVLETGSGNLSFSDYELVEVYARSLRFQDRYDEAASFVEDILLKTNCDHPPPARALGELSFTMVLLERHCSRAAALSNSFGKSIAIIDYTANLQRANDAYERASDAYCVEWTRGTWVFKFCPARLQQTTFRFHSRIGIDLQPAIAHTRLQMIAQKDSIGPSRRYTENSQNAVRTDDGPSSTSLRYPPPPLSAPLDRSQLGSFNARASEKLLSGNQARNPKDAAEHISFSKAENSQTDLNIIESTIQTSEPPKARMTHTKRLKRDIGVRKALQKILPTRARYSEIPMK